MQLIEPGRSFIGLFEYVSMEIGRYVAVPRAMAGAGYQPIRDELRKSKREARIWNSARRADWRTSDRREICPYVQPFIT